MRPCPFANPCAVKMALNVLENGSGLRSGQTGDFLAKHQLIFPIRHLAFEPDPVTHVLQHLGLHTTFEHNRLAGLNLEQIQHGGDS
jgi:hypothetical protein